MAYTRPRVYSVPECIIQSVGAGGRSNDKPIGARRRSICERRKCSFCLKTQLSLQPVRRERSDGLIGRIQPDSYVNSHCCHSSSFVIFFSPPSETAFRRTVCDWCLIDTLCEHSFPLCVYTRASMQLKQNNHAQAVCVMYGFSPLWLQ